jgi:hypothetical protein
MRKVAFIAVAAIATGVIAGVVLAGGGDGGSSNRDVTVPELKPPPGDLGGTTTDEGTTGDEGTAGDQGGTTTAPDSTGGAQAPAPDETGGSGESGGANAPEDTQQRDTPPPQGSPAERFEQFCNENPGAC